jgi:hypothetical protein
MVGRQNSKAINIRKIGIRASVPSGSDWLNEIKYDGLYEASRVKKFSRKTFFQEARVA